MNRQHIIRPAFVKDYHEHERALARERFALLRERDAHLTALNAAVGNRPGISYQGRADPAYDARYRAIDAQYGARSTPMGDREEARRAADMTIPECLFLDNYFPSDLAELCERADFGSLHYFSFIEAKARMLLTRWKADFNYQGMARRVEMEVQDFRFARKRCWRRFGLPVWDIDAWRQARLYRTGFAGRLRDGLRESTLA